MLNLSQSFTVNGSDSVIFEIKSGSSVDEIMDDLEKKGVLLRNDRQYFLRSIIRNGKDRSIASGNYLLPVPSNPESLALILERGPVKKYVTIPEGLTIEQTASILSTKANCDSAEFIKLCTQTEMISAVFSGDRFRSDLPSSLEGFLFPSTYDFGFGASPAEAIQEMVFLYFTVIDSVERPQIMILNDYEVLILASMIEKEAKVDEEREVISSVYINRLTAGMPLQCDATILYALGGHREKIYFRDLEINSPYNTYLYKGLPPTPICNPGKKSIEAAYCPSETDYFYYVAKKDGTHIFSKTYTEHIRAVNSVRNN
ncbi:endolytic transglycosylase MltG [candidate division WOR-3 bacterium]|nr:endolytic transglycosylase MltG [candidate division WOR-3 bacterium]